MKRCLLTLTLLLSLFCVSQADVYVSPEEHQIMAKEWLARQLVGVPPERQHATVQEILEKRLPEARRELELKVKMAESGESQTGPPVYMLKKGFETLDYQEAATKAWLSEHQKDAMPSPSTDSSSSSMTPVERSTGSQTTMTKPLMSGGTLSVAFILLASSVLLALRRTLAA